MPLFRSGWSMKPLYETKRRWRSHNCQIKGGGRPVAIMKLHPKSREMSCHACSLTVVVMVTVWPSISWLPAAGLLSNQTAAPTVSCHWEDSWLLPTSPTLSLSASTGGSYEYGKRCFWSIGCFDEINWSLRQNIVSYMHTHNMHTHTLTHTQYLSSVKIA